MLWAILLPGLALTGWVAWKAIVFLLVWCGLLPPSDRIER